MSRISQYTTLTAVQADDVVPIVDVHDTSMAGSGTTKKITVANLTANTIPAVPPSGDTTGVTDYANLQAALGNGYLQMLPGSYYLSQPLSVPASGAVIYGAGRSGINQNTQTQVYAVAPMPAIIASANWLGSGSASVSNSVTMEGFQVYGKYNGTQYATHGIALQTWDSLIRDVDVSFVTGDGIRFDAANQAQSAFITTSGVNNRIYDCTFLTAGQGIACYDGTTYSGGTTTFTDGFIGNCTVAGTTGAWGITIDHAAGWIISGCHLYGLGQNGIRAYSAGMTNIMNSYLEYVGSTSAAGTYTGIYAPVFGDFPVIIAGNRFWYYQAPGSSSSTITCITLSSGTAASNIVCSGNAGYLDIASGFAAAYPVSLTASSSSDAIQVTGLGGNMWAGPWTALALQTLNGGKFQNGPNPWVPVTLSSPFSGTVRYRLYPDNTVHLSGGVSLTASASQYQAMFTLPWIPATTQYFMTPESGMTAGNPTVVVYTGSGNVDIAEAASSGAGFRLDGIVIALD